MPDNQRKPPIPPVVSKDVKGAPVRLKPKIVRKPLYANPTIIAALIAVAGPPLTLWVASAIADPPTVIYQFTVGDNGTGKPIPDAHLTLELDPFLGKVSPLHQDTPPEGTGFFLFQLPKRFINKIGRIQVKAIGYQTGTQPMQLALALPVMGFLLTPIQADVPPTPLPVKLDPYTRTKTLGPVPSGSGSGKLNYTIESDSPQAGYKITNASYSLSGDRAPCGSWSWCSWKQNDETKAIFAFQLQGHNEWMPPGVSFSTGTLTVTYGPK